MFIVKVVKDDVLIQVSNFLKVKGLFGPISNITAVIMVLNDYLNTDSAETSVLWLDLTCGAPPWVQFLGYLIQNVHAVSRSNHTRQ